MRVRLRTERPLMAEARAPGTEFSAGGSSRRAALCVETQGRDIMAFLVHDVVTDAMRLNLFVEPADRVVEANGAPLGERANRVRNG